MPTSRSRCRRNCLFYDIMLGRKSLDDLKRLLILDLLTSNASVARMFVVERRSRAV